MNRKYISKSSIEIKSAKSKIWEALINPELAKTYFFGAQVSSDWKEGNSITFTGSYNGNNYEEKGILLAVKQEKQLQYTHWSNLDGIPDIPENYRVWTFDLIDKVNHVKFSVTEDNIPTEKQKLRSDEFWAGVLLKIKILVEE